MKHLHQRRISTFLVTNAQFPDAIRDLTPVTQLYVSIDASTKDSLKKIDRPLFKDFWERFIQSLVELEKKGQRTVYRLTLVKGWNAEEMENYARLVDIGKPDFIEVKGVTYCGTSKGMFASLSPPLRLISGLRFSLDADDGERAVARRSAPLCPPVELSSERRRLRDRQRARTLQLRPDRTQEVPRRRAVAHVDRLREVPAVGPGARGGRIARVRRLYFPQLLMNDRKRMLN